MKRPIATILAFLMAASLVFGSAQAQMSGDPSGASGSAGGVAGVVGSESRGCLPNSPLGADASVTRDDFSPAELGSWTRTNRGTLAGDSVTAGPNGEAVVDAGTNASTGIEYQDLTESITPTDGDVVEFSIRAKQSVQANGVLVFGLIEQDTSIVSTGGLFALTFANGTITSFYGDGDKDWGARVGDVSALLIVGDVFDAADDGFITIGVRMGADDISDITTHYGQAFINGVRVDDTSAAAGLLAFLPQAQLHPSLSMIRGAGATTWTLDEACVAHGKASSAIPLGREVLLNTRVNRCYNVTIPNPTDASDRYEFKFDVPMTIQEITCITDVGSVPLDFEERDPDGTNGVEIVQFGSATCDSDGASFGTISNASMDADDWMFSLVGVPTGSPTSLAVRICGFAPSFATPGQAGFGP